MYVRYAATGAVMPSGVVAGVRCVLRVCGVCVRALASCFNSPIQTHTCSRAHAERRCPEHSAPLKRPTHPPQTNSAAMSVFYVWSLLLGPKPKGKKGGGAPKRRARAA